MTVTYRLRLPFSIIGVLNKTKLRSVIYDRSVHNSYFPLLKVFKEQKAPTTARVVSKAYHQCLHFSRSVMYDQSVDSSCFAVYRLSDILSPSLSAIKSISDQKKILNNENAQTTGSVVSVANCFWVHFSINRIIKLTESRSVIYDQSVDSICFAVWELISTAQLKRRSWRNRKLKPFLEFWGVAYRLWLPFSIRRVFKLTKWS